MEMIALATFRRDRTAGATWFFTVVTRGREPWLRKREATTALREAIRATRSACPFEIVAAVVLPDHIHMIWTLPEDDADYGKRWSLIKRLTGDRLIQAESTTARRERGLWQRRFWEHRIRDEDDRDRHVDYIHHNPVKHGLAAKAADWPHSSIHRYIRNGWIAADWGCEPAPSRSFGE
jgi:putative transposase